MNSLWLERICRLALDEDLGSGDITTEAVVSPESRGRAELVAKAEGVVAGLPVVEAVFSLLDGLIRVQARVGEGDRVRPGGVLAEIAGPTRAVLTGERVALNFLQRLCGIATRTAAYVEAVQGYRARITDTRKTAPGLRLLDKYAVTAGGGVNHRLGLADAVLIKDNHIRAAGSIKAAVARVRERVPFTAKIEVEAESLPQVQEALAAGVDIIMLDNMALPAMREAVDLIAGRALVEASGGIDLRRVREVAACGVDLISVGELTHSVRALDISLDFIG